ncbi:hypothetical protein WOLCODRAFT_137096 [Wolfiporia cocos MD-104 SS10]|uniref:Uncharacterized protein n=1 Tax=Wolfiporia cocos (strain MD-104) TaxID=742152 RepID=A0A2H3JT12_WOLCO|nr:hypothetical protein WOLCODRAFT_137096 [Wolfiporia cocos MD-104 SS10]
MSNTVVFPATLLAGGTSTSDNAASVSAHTHRATALEICELVYAPARPSWDALERFYEPGATYESPLVTATSRAAIADVHALAHRLAQLDVPRPGALLHALLGGGGAAPTLFTAVRVWDEVRDVAETDSFDGHHKAIVEHTLHIDLLPGLLGPGSLGPSAPPASASAAASSAAPSELVAVSSPHHPLPRPHDRPPPLRLSLPVLTRLSFNDAGRITHHRDFWDAKDLLGLLPGMALVQWVATRALAHGISALVRAGRILVRARAPCGDGDGDEGTGGRDEEEGLARGRAIKGSSGAGRAQA